MATAKILRGHVWLLTALVATEIVSPLLTRERLTARILFVVLFVGVAVGAFSAVLHTKRQRYAGMTLAGTAFALLIARDEVPTALQLPFDVTSSIVIGAFWVFIFFELVAHLFRTRHLGFDDVVGAFSGYLMIALIWGRLYALVWQVVPSSFSISPDITWQLSNWHTLHTLFDYFSLTTLATVGYGDVTTTAPASNTLVWLEVMCGQFYLAVVVATIVGIKVSQALAAPADRGDDS